MKERLILFQGAMVHALLTPEKRARIVTLAKSGRFSKTEIAAMVGTTKAVVQGICTRDGIVARDGRAKATRRGS